MAFLNYGTCLLKNRSNHKRRSPKEGSIYPMSLLIRGKSGVKRETCSVKSHFYQTCNMSQHYRLPQEIFFLNVGTALCPLLGLGGCNAWLQLAHCIGEGWLWACGSHKPAPGRERKGQAEHCALGSNAYGKKNNQREFCQDKNPGAHTGTQRCHLNTRKHLRAVRVAVRWHSCPENVDLLLRGAQKSPGLQVSEMHYVSFSVFSTASQCF